MTLLHRYYVTEQLSRDGVFCYAGTGSPVTIDGTPSVRLAGGICVPADGWHADLAAAKEAAATRIEELAARLLRQARTLREHKEKSGG